MQSTIKILAVAFAAAFATAASAQVVTENEFGETVVNVVTANTTPQNTVTLTNAQLSEQYKLQLNVINNELKTLKSQAKLYKADAIKSAEVASMMASKKAEMADVKAKKRIADQAVKTEKASRKASEKAEKARRKAEAAAEKAAMLQK